MGSTIEVKDGKKVIDYMARDYDSFRQAMIDLIPEKLPEWTDRSEADFGIVLIELFAYMADILSYYQDRIANESFLATAQERRSIIQHLRLIGYELAPAAPASALLSLIVTNDKKNTIQVEKGDQFATRSSKTEQGITFEYIGGQPLSIDLSKLKKDSAGAGFKKYTGIPVVQGKTVSNEKIGTSNGSPTQRFKLLKPKMIKDSLKIHVKTPDTIDCWTLKNSLIFSRHNDKHYFIQTDENDITTVYFGDGVYGRIPDKDSEIIALYRIGGGVEGNVGTNKIEIISNAPQLQALAAKVTNDAPASGGKDRESIEHAIKFAPRVFRSLDRAVTEQDFVNIALSYPGVAKAKAKSSGWNKIILYIVPEGEQCQLPTEILKKQLTDFFEDKRMIGTSVDISNPIYVPFDIWLKVTAAHNYLRDEIKKKAEEAVKKLFKLDNVNFGQAMYLSKVYETIETLEGVDAVFVYMFNRRDHLEFKDERKAKNMSNEELKKRFSEPKSTVDLDTHIGSLIKNPIARDGIVKMGTCEIPILGELPNELYVRVEGGLLKGEDLS